MKEIQPVSIWVNGELLTANRFNLYIINDNLVDSAVLFYALISATDFTDPITSDITESILNLTQGNISITGAEYDTWGESGDVNNEAYNICAAKLNLTLIP